MESNVITINLRIGVLILKKNDSYKLRSAFLSVESQNLGLY